jgi:hypothetical protein
VSNYHPHTLVTFGGILNTTAVDHEIWQCGVRVVKPGNPGAPLDDHDAYMTSIAAPLATWFGDSGFVPMPPSANLQWLKANPIGSDGKYTDPITHLHDYAVPQTGGGVIAQVVPDILCVCLSWQTAKAIRHHSYATHGRIYPPNYGAFGLSVGSMRIGPDKAQELATKGAALLTILKGTSVPAIPIIASGHSGEYEHITGCRVGDVYDVQRRRKSALREVYSAVAFSSG